MGSSKFLFRFIVLILCQSVQLYGWLLRANGQNVLSVSVEKETKYYTRCWLGGWMRCSKYRTYYVTRYQCASGWRSEGHSECIYAVCNGHTGENACRQSAYVMKKSGTSLEKATGSCVRPDICANCGTYFYSEYGPICKPCPRIDNCLEMHCQDTYSSTICANCDGVVMDQRYYMAYVRSKDEKRCQQACSWRADSTRCYPGYCAEGLAANCTCVAGFTGKHCEIMTEKANVVSNLFKLKENHLTIENPSNMNLVTENSPIVWSNKNGWNIADTEWVATYVINETLPTDEDHYIRRFVYGIIEASTTLNYTYTVVETIQTVINNTEFDALNDTDMINNSSTSASNSSSPKMNITYVSRTAEVVEVYQCPQASKTSPPTSTFSCQKEFKLESKGRSFNFSHGDTLTFTIQAKIGGHMIMTNREKGIIKDKRPTGINETHFLVGTTKRLQYVYRWDFISPNHCLEVSDRPQNCIHPLIVPDVTDDPFITISWGDWLDDLSGLLEYHYEIHTVSLRRNTLSENGKLVDSGTLFLNHTSKELLLDKPGLFSIHLIAFDKAKNYKVTRRLVLYDSNSHVSHNPFFVTRLQTGSPQTNYTWVVKNTTTVKLVWPLRFRNALHSKNKWLDEVVPNPNILHTLDDLYGVRPVKKVNNMHGCVDFLVEFHVYDGSGIKDSQSLTSVKDISTESETLTMDWADGDKAVITVVAKDIFNKTLNDTLTVYRDSTPPIVENLWLTRGERLNLTVHRLEDFTEMTIEWLAYDFHSGIDTIYWRLYDNSSGEDIIHGHEDLHAQGSSQNIEECMAMYGNYSRGGNCYQTNHMGAFHRHFHVKPQVKVNGGLVSGKDVGIHDSDYFLEINATNKALLSTVLTKKITIDISPPHAGFVQDGTRGTDEVDFQQSKTLAAYWDGFFDKESGVMFYMYGFSALPIPAADFQLDSNNSIVKETYSSHATHIVTSEGTYYACVVAYNRALEPSEPVCSDRVTITTYVPSVSEVDISSAHVREGLVTDTGRTYYWLVGTNRHRRLIENPTTDCMSKVVVVPNVDIFPMDYYQNGSNVHINGSVFCLNTSSTSLVTSPVFSKSSHIKISWSSNEKLIHDYAIGLSTSAGSAAPDILAFKSTNQHRHFHLMHADLPEGRLFYLLIKAIGKSNIFGIQSIGPCILDTSPPIFTPPLTVRHESGYLVVSWNGDTFLDPDDPFPLNLQVAVGHIPRGTQVQEYSQIKFGASCVLTMPPTCSAIPLSDTEWGIHGNHTYYVTVKAENAAGLTTYGVSEPYVHNVQLPSKGIVMDVTGTLENSFVDIEDIDFKSKNSSLTAKWTGFYHAFVEVTYQFRAGTSPGAADVVQNTDVGKKESYTVNGLILTYFTTYYITITANSSAGYIEVTSDGITIVKENAILNNISVFEGEPCNDTGGVSTSAKHHDWNVRRNCSMDVDFQSSTDSLSGYWIVPKDLLLFTPDMYFSIEHKSLYGDDWSIFQNYTYNHGHYQAHVTGLLLDPGRLYRFAVKLCAGETCYQPVHSNGVLILANPPTTGALDVQHDNTTVPEKLIVVFDMFADPDIRSPKTKYEIIDRYEWAITDQSKIGRLHTNWQEVKNYNTTGHTYKIELSVSLEGKFDFSKCRLFTIRGYNKAGLYSTVSNEIKDCSAFDPVLIKPNIVIDAVGKSDPSRDGYGEAILLQTNARWPYPDMDYTPNMNYISAVWPTLRYNSYSVAVLKAQNLDVTTYYLPSTTLSLSDPCGHPDAIKCETTEHEFINVKFKEGELEHGYRYIVCIHTQYTEIHFEKWTQVLPEINTCSDGIRVDLTPPSPGNVWIGTPGQSYQISTTDLYITWESFEDIEETQTISHSSGIQNYFLGIGTSVGGNDVVATFDVGVVNHKVIHGLTLHSGHTYYATITAIDLANRTSIQTSGPVTVDTSPPIKSDNPITIQGRHITSTTEIGACWKGVFSDPESDIDYFMWSVGSQPGHSDIMEFTRENSECGSYDKNHRLELKEGHPYYISVQAYNRARLMTLATSWAYIVDLSAPLKGHVFDVLPSGDSKTDVDFQTNLSRLKVAWTGFHDPHSSIKEYFICIGTCSSCDDVIARQSVGLINEVEVDYVHIGSGLTYFTKVTACNTADLCTSVVSDGVTVDNSPPNGGVVTDGTSSDDIEYQSITNWIGAKWYGFTDPQSGISHYVWWAGKTTGGNDILEEREVHLVEEATAYNFSKVLPKSERIYVTVRAYNKAGLFVDVTSNGFLVDPTAPDIKRGPTFTRDFGLVKNTQFYRSSIKVEWKVEDPESHIEKQYLSLRSHLGGDFELSSTQVNGIARDFVLTGLKLHDGVTYYVTLVSCSGAQLCSSSTSSGILVDCSPPNRGMFAVQTDHAVDKELSRHVSGFMTWWKYAVNLAWLGFSDAHSDITHYLVNVGSTYMGEDLNAIEGFPKRIYHSTIGKDCYDEGRVQTYTITTQKLVAYDFLYISIWAVNQVGLSSAIVHSKFKKLPQGILSLVRRCESEDCEGQCVCAPQDKMCPGNGSLCNDVTNGNPNYLLQVSDVMFGTPEVQFTPSDTVLQGRWSVVHRQGKAPFMYQWSVGFTDHDVPAGILDPQHDRVWHDAGQQTFVVYTTKQGEALEEAVSYSVFVKVWYNRNTYTVFKSNGVVIETQRPEVLTVLGSSITERMITSLTKDDDYIQEGVALMVNWTNKFLNDKATIKSYHVYISTTPGGHDTWDSGDDLPNTETTYLVRRISLLPDVRYYVNVIAYGFSGIHHTESSDGFYIDNMKPKAGSIFDGTGLHDLEYQNKSNTIGATWHGFSDSGSGVKKYFWCVGNTSSISECNVRGWEDVGIYTSVSRMLSNNLFLGKVYYNKVYAIDVVGYNSTVVVSNGVTIDVTPPQPESLFHTQENILKNPSFESYQKFLSVEDIYFQNICDLTTDYIPGFWSITAGSCTTVLSSRKNLARDGRSFLFIRGSIKQEIDRLILGGLYRVDFFSSHIPVKGALVSNKEGFISIGKSKHLFLLYSKAYRHDDHESSSSRDIISWHRHTFYFTVTDVKSDFEIGSMDAKTGIFIDEISIRHVERIHNISATTHVPVHVVYVHQWGSIHASWSFFEDISPIKEYSWAIVFVCKATEPISTNFGTNHPLLKEIQICTNEGPLLSQNGDSSLYLYTGYTQGGTQIQRFISAGISNFGYNSNVTLIHNTYVHVTVTATNTAEMVGTSYSDPIHVDLTPPDIVYVYDGRSSTADEDAWTDNEVVVNFMANDDESGIEYCEWAIGYQPQGIELQSFERLTNMNSAAFKDFDYNVLENKTVYSTIRCHNRAGLLASKSSDGVKISVYPPSITNAELSLTPLSTSEYQAGNHYQSNINNVRIRWSGFEDFTGIEQFKITFTNDKSTFEEKMSFPNGQLVQSASLMNMNMPEGLQNITLQAISKVLLTSEEVLYNMTAIQSKPTKKGTTLKHSWHAGNKEYTLSWDGIFVSKYPLFYEVSVGTVEGGCDILQWQETTRTNITFGFPPTITNMYKVSLYVYVRAISAGGTYEGVKFVIT